MKESQQYFSDFPFVGRFIHVPFIVVLPKIQLCRLLVLCMCEIKIPIVIILGAKETVHNQRTSCHVSIRFQCEGHTCVWGGDPPLDKDHPAES